jgi:hypothetical protein
MKPAILFLLLIVYGCSSKNSPPLNKILANGCFWDIIDNDSQGSTINSCYQFKSNGSCYIFLYEFRSHKMTDSVYKYYIDDVIVPETWETNGDTALNARGFDYKVVKYTRDSIYLQTIRHRSIVLVRNCKTIYPKE